MHFLRAKEGKALPIALLFCAGFVVSADIRVLTPLLPAIAGDFGVSIGTAGLSVAVYGLAYAVGQFFYGPLGDRVGKVLVIRAVLLLFSIGTALCALSPNFPVLLALRLVTGFFAAGVIPMSLAYFGDSVADYADRRRTIGTFLSALITGQVFGQALGGLLAGLFNWTAIFLVIGGIGLLVGGALWRYPAPARPAERPTHRPGFRATFAGDRRLYLLVLAEMLIYLGPFSFAGAELVDEQGVSYALAGGLLALSAVGAILSARTFHRVRFVEADSVRVALGVAIAIPGVVLLALIPSPALFGLAVFLIGLGMTLAHSTLQTRATEVDPLARGTAVALFAGLANVGAALGTFAAGAVVDSVGYEALFLGVAVAMVGFAVVAHTILTGRPPGGRHATAPDLPSVVALEAPVVVPSGPGRATPTQASPLVRLSPMCKSNGCGQMRAD
jgi:predicted MFS family arabinose efflux permease